MALACLAEAGCSSNYKADYEIPSPSGQYVALLGSNTYKWNHQLRVLRDGQVILDREVHRDAIESGIDDARWSPDGSRFAVKVCGDGVEFVTIFEISTGRSETFDGADSALVPTWTGFDAGCTFSDNLSLYEVRAKGD